MTDVEERLARLEKRLSDTEDRLALLQIVAAYGPAVDSGSADETARMWTEDGVYDTFPVVLRGREEIAGMVTGERHQGLIHGGAAHLLGIPHIELHGDSAVVTTYSQLVLREADADGYRIWRTGVNRWEFVRTGDGWRVTHRVNRQLDGSDEGRELSARGVRDCPVGPRDSVPPPGCQASLGRLVQPLRSARAYQPAAARVPPSTGMVWPVTKRASSEARNSTTAA